MPLHKQRIGGKLVSLTLLGFISLSLSFFMTGCTGTSTKSEPTSEIGGVTSYFETSTPEAQGMDSELLNAMYVEIASSYLDVHHVLILRNGIKVSEANYYPYGPEDIHILNSVTKNFTSALIGKAIEEGLIQGVDQPVLDFFKDRTTANVSEQKKSLKLEHLLTMTAGFDWTEEGNYGAADDSNTNMWKSENQTQFVLDLNMKQEPGTEFYYTSGSAHLMSGILSQVTGKNAEAYAKEKLFTPLGIENYMWGSDNQGVSSGGSRLFLSAEDLAKFGVLYLNKGNWNGEQLISEEWVAASTQKYFDTPNGPSSHSGYGYQWWMNPFGGYSGRGFGGQFLYVVPDSDLVVVFMGSMGSTFFKPDVLMAEYILPAIQSPNSIEDNPTAYNSLVSTQGALTKEPESRKVPALSETAKEISGQSFSLEDGNVIGVDFTEGSSEALLHWFTDGEQYDVPVGLDGIYRFSQCSGFYLPDYVSEVGFSGKWTTDNTFVILVCPTDGDATYTLALTYNNGTLKKTFRSNLTGR